MYPGGEPALRGALGLLERAVGYTRVSLSLVHPDDLRGPTPCRDWDVGALLRHMDDSLAALHEAAGGQVELRRPPDPACGSAVDDAGLRESIRARACALLGAWTADGASELVRVAGSPVTAAVLAGAGALEIAVHGWDLAQGCGRAHPLPPALAEELLELVPLLVSGQDRPGRFADPRVVSPHSPADERLLAALGRSPSSDGSP